MNPAVPGTAATFGYLSGAPIAAKNLGAWASSVFGPANVQIVTDEYVGKAPNPVTKDRVQKAVDALFPKNADPVSHFILGFCGHGLTDENIKSISWLFSDSLEQKYRVKADLFYTELLLHGIKRLTLISDACREVPKEATLQRLFPDRGIVVQGTQNESPRFDSLVACQDTQLGFMVAEQNNVAVAGKCVFSGVLADALWGNEPLAYDGNRMTVNSLALCLQERTPEVAKKYRLKLTPDCAINPAPETLFDKTAAPLDLPELQAWPAAGSASILGIVENAAKAANISVNAEVELMRFNGSVNFRAKVLGRPASTPKVIFARLPRASAPVVGSLVALQKNRVSDLGPKAEKLERSLAERLTADVAKTARYKASGDLRRSLSQLRMPEAQGLSNLIIAEAGATLWSRQEATLGNRTRAREGFRASDIPLGSPNLVELHDGRFVPWVPYQGLYTVMKRSRLGDIFQAYGRPVPGMSANFKSGLEVLGDFASGSIAQSDVCKLAADLRDTKHSDPVLGVICSYLYRAIADFDNIRRMAYFYVMNAQPIPFDLVLLGEIPVTPVANGGFTVHVPAVREGSSADARGLPTYVFQRTPEVEGTVGGWCPWLGLGWDYVTDPRPEWAALVDGLAKLAPLIQRRGFTWFPEAHGRRLARKWQLGASLQH